MHKTDKNAFVKQTVDFYQGNFFFKAEKNKVCKPWSFCPTEVDDE